MRNYGPIRRQRDYDVPLLELLAGMPGQQARKSALMKAFEQRYGSFLSADQYERLSSNGVPRWQQQITNAGTRLTTRGFLYAPAWGVWGATRAALDWLDGHPQDTHLDHAVPEVRQRQGSDPDTDSPVCFQLGGRRLALSQEQVLTAAREAIRQGLPEQAREYRTWAVEVDGHLIGVKWLFRLITGADGLTTYRARDILGRQLGLPVVRVPRNERVVRAQGTASARHGHTEEEEGWLVGIRTEVLSLRSFLQGRSPRPSDERLCDWVQLCYLIGLHREATALFALVERGGVNEWLYERTRKLASVCALRSNPSEPVL
ncbi:MAG: hypothetical protein ACUVX9_09370 [Anaerolineae bacterium]